MKAPESQLPEGWDVWDALGPAWGYIVPMPSYIPEPQGRWLLDEELDEGDVGDEQGIAPPGASSTGAEPGELERWH